jgi:hypothetical protein
VRQVDHFHFRASMQGATAAKPLTLKGADAWQAWVKPYYDPSDLKYLDRQLFSRVTPG